MILIPLGLFCLFGGMFLFVLFMPMMCDEGGVSLSICIMLFGVLLIAIDFIMYFIFGNPAFDPFKIDLFARNINFTWNHT